MYYSKKAYLHNNLAQPSEILYMRSVVIAEQILKKRTIKLNKNSPCSTCLAHILPKKAYLHNDSVQPSKILYMHSVAIEEQIKKRTKKIEQKLTVQYMFTPCTTQKKYLHNDSAQPSETLYTRGVAIEEQIKKELKKLNKNSLCTQYMFSPYSSPGMCHVTMWKNQCWWPGILKISLEVHGNRNESKINLDL